MGHYVRSCRVRVCIAHEPATQCTRTRNTNSGINHSLSRALPESSPSKYLTIRSSPDLTSELDSRTQWGALLVRNACKTLSDLQTPLITFIWDRKGRSSALHFTKAAMLLLSLTFNSELRVTCLFQVTCPRLLCGGGVLMRGLWPDVMMFN